LPVVSGVVSSSGIVSDIVMHVTIRPRIHAVPTKGELVATL